jgi:hypothetical protein
MADVFDRNQRCYPQVQSAFDAIPNTGGAATVGNSDCCLITALTMDAKQAEIARPDKTGSLDQIVAQAGRRIASFSASMSAAGNGAAGTAPDCKNFLQGIFGAAGVVVASTSVTWSLADTLYYLAIWNFMTALANATSMVAFNALVQKMEATFGGDTPLLTFSGEAGWVLDNDQYADGSTPAAAKGGLTAWPSEPSAPVVNGTPPAGFKVTATIDGNAYTNILSGKVALDVMRELLKTGNTEFPGAGAPGDRKVTLDFSMADNDSANLRGLKQKAFTRTPVNAVFTVGTIAGNRWVHTLNNIIVPKPTYGTSGTRRTVNFAGAVAYPSAITAKDQYTLAIN